MNDEISRILKLLEDGKITADEAERLIRSLTDSRGAGSERTKRWEVGSGEPGAVWKAIRRTLRSVARAQRRSAWWQYFWAVRRTAEARSKRAAEMSIAERVDYLLVECGLADKESLSPTAALEGDLGCCAMARQLLRYALEDEFGITVTNEEANRFATVADIVAFVAERLNVADTRSDEQSPEGASGESPAPA